MIIGFQQDTKRACRRQKLKWGKISALPMYWIDTKWLKNDNWKSWVCFVPCSLPLLKILSSGSVTQSLDKYLCRATRERCLPTWALGWWSEVLHHVPAATGHTLSDMGHRVTTNPTCLLIYQTGMWKLPHSTILHQMCCWTSCVYVCEENIGWKALQKCKIWFVLI